jgi:hypothetical protein
VLVRRVNAGRSAQGLGSPTRAQATQIDATSPIPRSAIPLPGIGLRLRQVLRRTARANSFGGQFRWGFEPCSCSIARRGRPQRAPQVSYSTHAALARRRTRPGADNGTAGVGDIGPGATRQAPEFFAGVKSITFRSDPRNDEMLSWSSSRRRQRGSRVALRPADQQLAYDRAGPRPHRHAVRESGSRVRAG